MASSSFSAGTSIDVPQTQNTAPVLEFRCLYTQDLRRKQKRWQDGRLKFHTFNKRVMVYDERSNFVGDTHWREDTALDEGEELELERGGILVEVGECVGKRDQDLFELVDKRVKEREERAAAKIAASLPSRPQASLIWTTQATPGPLQHKPLNAMLAPTGHYGRAVAPQNSPFEEKQRLINGNQDGSENGRAVKRRKHNEDAPSKNSYAQNLMGATLTLASSKPPSTATIRYEPVGIRPSVWEIPTPTIDLTGDDDDADRDTASKRVSIREGRASGERRSNGRRRLERSPARGGYARNITGVSLTLSRPKELSLKRGSKIIDTGVSAKSMLQGKGDSSSETEDGNFIDIHSIPVKLPAPTKTSKEPIRKPISSTERNTAFDLGSSSSILTDDAPSLTKTSKGLTRKKVRPANELPSFEDQSSSPTSTTKLTKNFQQPPNQNYTDTEPSPGQPVSALRIKARSPRKMMMLMDRPSSCSFVTAKSSSTIPQKPRPQISSLRSDEVVLSQATMQLNAFCQKQEEIIQARLNGKRTNVDFEDPLSSPGDRGIDHQTIDLLLSRNGLPFDNKAAAGPIQLKPTHQESDLGIQPKGPHHTNDLNSRDMLRSQSKRTSPSIPENTATILRDDQASGPDPLPGSNSIGEREKSVSRSSAIESENNAAASGPALPREPMSEVVTDPPLVSTEEKNEHTPLKVSQESPAIKTLPEHFSSAIQAATEHFRAIIKSSASSTIQLPGGISSPPGAVDNSEPIPSAEPCTLQKETASCEIVVKPAPRPSSLVGEVSNIGSELFQVEPGPDPEKGLDGSFGKAGVTEANNWKADAPKARLVNPATRGKSLQTIAASTVDSVTPVFSLMPPPPPSPPSRIIGRPQRSYERTIVAEERATPGGYAGERAITGPWSRESFDLFGSWLPPGSAQGVANNAQANTR